MRKIAWIFFSLFTVPLAQAAPTIEQHWAKTGLSVEDLRALIEPENCYQDEVRFRACLAALTPENSSSAPAGASPSFAARPKFDFIPIFKKLEHALRQSAERTSSLVAERINAYLRIKHDAYARIEPASYVTEKQSQQNARKYIGIGGNLRRDQTAWVVDRLVENGPAEKAGLRAGDVLTQIDGQGIGTWDSIADVARVLMGAPESAVRIQYQRGQTKSEITVTRKDIAVKNVVSQIVTYHHRKYGYLKLRSFAPKNTCEKIAEGTRELVAQKVEGILLDLRDNEGGLVDQAVCIAGLFLGPDQLVVREKNILTQKQIQKITQGPKLTTLPMITLINDRTASSAEIVCGAFQDHGRSLIVGKRSFGKGTIQTLKPFPGNPAITLYSTVYQFLLPSGRTNQDVGIVPDLPVEERGRALASVHSLATPSSGSRLAKLRNCATEDSTSDETESDPVLSYAKKALNCAKKGT